MDLKKLKAENERLREQVQRMRYGIRDALTLLQPQAKVMNPSLLAVREAVSILRPIVAY